MIPHDQWEWFGDAGHFICGHDCRFHLCTLVGEYLVSTVGKLLFDESSRESLSERRGVVLQGRGDARRADYLNKVGYEEIGYQRLYETMVFKAAATRCTAADCNCGLPTIADPSDPADFNGYNTAGEATRGHIELCSKFAERQEPSHV